MKEVLYEDRIIRLSRRIVEGKNSDRYHLIELQAKLGIKYESIVGAVNNLRWHPIKHQQSALYFNADCEILIEPYRYLGRKFGSKILVGHRNNREVSPLEDTVKKICTPIDLILCHCGTKRDREWYRWELQKLNQVTGGVPFVFSQSRPLGLGINLHEIKNKEVK